MIKIIETDMKARYIENSSKREKSKLIKSKDRIYTELMVQTPLSKGTIIWYEFKDSFLKYELLEDFNPLVWKSPDAFIDSIADFIEEDIIRNGRS